MTMHAHGTTTPAPNTIHANAARLLSELCHADRIILAMLNAMTPAQQAKAHVQLDAAGVSGEGMTRHHERRAAIEAAAASVAESCSATAPAAALSILRAIDDASFDVDCAASMAGDLLDLAVEECTTTKLSRVFSAIMAAERCLGDIVQSTRKLREMGRQGGAA